MVWHLGVPGELVSDDPPPAGTDGCYSVFVTTDGLFHVVTAYYCQGPIILGVDVRSYPAQLQPVRGHTALVVPASLLPHLRNARDLADRHYHSPLDLDALAGAAHVSKYHFARCFTETYGETPMRYLTRRRIERAQDLLRSVNLTVTEVCMMVGFTSLGSFSSRFRELVGESPTQYRDRWAARGGPHIPGCFLFMRGIDGWADGRQAQDSNLGEASAPAVP
jgi:AraC-like DNA-binding protein